MWVQVSEEALLEFSVAAGLQAAFLQLYVYGVDAFPVLVPALPCQQGSDACEGLTT